MTTKKTTAFIAATITCLFSASLYAENAQTTTTLLEQTEAKASLVKVIPHVTEKCKEGHLPHLADTKVKIFKESDRTFFGIYKDDQQSESSCATKEKYDRIKAHLLEEIDLHPQSKVIQVVGDSDAFTLESTKRAAEFLSSQVDEDCVVLYGYTGHKKADGRCCVNALVSNMITNANMEGRAIGNLVGYHTKAALSSWGCTGADLKYYILVYGDDDSKKETGALFGDDIITSDYISDEFIVLEGGIQSFSQICNGLFLDKPTKGIGGLRNENGKKYFSATSFFLFLKNKLASMPSKTTVTKDEINAWKDEYFESYLIADPKRQDYSTKEGLFLGAWSLFLEKNLHLKLDLVEVF